MAKFQFRLEASLRLAKKGLEDEQRLFAENLRMVTQAKEAFELQLNCWNLAIAGQREASVTRPEQIGLWQKFSQKQLELLRNCDNDLKYAEKLLEEQRNKLIKANQEYEKFLRLKKKQGNQYRLEELRENQKVLDETAQALYFRKENL